MLKSTATALSECTAKHENQASSNRDYMFLTWLTFLVIYEKRSKRRLKKEIFILAKFIFAIFTLYWLKIGLLLVISENFLSTFRKNNNSTKKLKSLLSELFSYKILKNSTHQTNFLYINYFSIFVLRWDVFKLTKSPFTKKLKKQLMLTNFTLAMYKIAEKYCMPVAIPTQT